MSLTAWKACAIQLHTNEPHFVCMCVCVSGRALRRMRKKEALVIPLEIPMTAVKRWLCLIKSVHRLLLRELFSSKVSFFFSSISSGTHSASHSNCQKSSIHAHTLTHTAVPTGFVRWALILFQMIFNPPLYLHNLPLNFKLCLLHFWCTAHHNNYICLILWYYPLYTVDAWHKN